MSNITALIDHKMDLSSTHRTQVTRHKRICWILYLSGFLDLCGVGLVLALIPSRARDGGASTTMTGVIGSVYGGVQLLSSPIMGKWADGVSRKSSILLSLVLSSIGYGVMGLSPSITVLVSARIILGCFKHSQTMSKAYLADFLTDKERSAVLGRFNSFSSIGFVVGPTIGGHLAESSLGFGLVTAVSVLIFAINAGLVWSFLPHSDNKNCSLSSKSEGNSRPESSQATEDGIKENKSPLLLLTFWDLFLIIFFGSFSVIIYRNNFSLLMKEKFLASPKMLGYITSFTGLISTVCGFSVGKITERYKNNDAKLFRHVTIAQVFVFVCLSQAPSIPMIIAFLAPLSVITSVARVATTSITIQRCGKEKVAAVMGWSQSVTSVARMMAPFMAGVAQEWSMDAACYISLVACCISLVIMIAFPQGSKEDISISGRRRKRDN